MVHSYKCNVIDNAELNSLKSELEILKKLKKKNWRTEAHSPNLLASIKKKKNSEQSLENVILKSFKN